MIPDLCLLVSALAERLLEVPALFILFGKFSSIDNHPLSAQFLPCL